MSDTHDLLDTEEFGPSENRQVETILNTGQFVLLSILTMGLYGVWWMYKSWRFFQEKENLDIMPAARAIFSIFFLISLMNKILEYAREKGYGGDYSTVLLFVCFFMANLLSRLPDPYWLISLFGFFFLIPPFQALNYAKQNDPTIEAVEQDSFNTRQVILLVVFGAFWLLILAGLSMGV
jgi:hypothetical protein